ncbi:ABC transporter permease subunit [Lachnospiraceae bacterium 46-15]
MNKLISAGFARLKKDKVFWISVLLMLGIGIYLPISSYSFSQNYGQPTVLDSNIFSHIILAFIVFSVFCSLFIGTEYSDGTIRNKIAVGHTRGAVYLANLIVCTAANLIILAAYEAAYLCVGIPLLGFFQSDIRTILLFALCTVGICLAVSAILTLIAMLCHSKAITTVLCIIGMVILLCAGTYINSRLNQPEIYSNYSYVNGAFVEEGEQPNPLYLRGSERKVYEFLYDFLPSGQVAQCQEMTSKHPQLLLLYSGIILIAASGAGLCAFRRKDIK